MSDLVSIPRATFRELLCGGYTRAQQIVLCAVLEQTVIPGSVARIRVRELGRAHGIGHRYLSDARRDLIGMGSIREHDGGLVYIGPGATDSTRLVPHTAPGGATHSTTSGSPGSTTLVPLAAPNGAPGNTLSPHTPLSGNPDQTTTTDSRGGTGAGREPAAAPVGEDAYPWTADELAELRGLAVRLWRSEDDAEEIVAAARRLDLPHDGTLAAVRYVAGRDGVKNRVGLAVKTAREWGEEPPARWTADAPTPAERAAALPEIADRQAAEFFARPAMPPAEAARLAAELRRKFGIAPAPAPARMGA